MNDVPLGGLSPTTFLRRHWHKSPLLVSQAIPDFLGLLTPAEIRKLATHPHVQARLIIRSGKSWQLHHGPFRPVDFKTLPDKNWTVLIQDLNHWLPEAERLLDRFSFIPDARLDDLMVSYAMPVGGVGPHFYSYDVFLLQGFGIRRWSIAETRDFELRTDCDLKVLRRFKPQQQWDLSAGDMLYLPPQWAHDGVAVTECFTYSVGFRAPTHQEWVNAFLDHLRDHLLVEGRYADPDLKWQPDPAELSRPLLRQIAHILQSIRWTDQDVLSCVGRYLSEPKPHVFFEPPTAPLTEAAFRKALEQQGLRLDRRSRRLYHGRHFFLNGEEWRTSDAHSSFWKTLANQHATLPKKADPALSSLLHEFYLAGWVHLASPEQSARPAKRNSNLLRRKKLV